MPRAGALIDVLQNVVPFLESYLPSDPLDKTACAIDAESRMDIISLLVSKKENGERINIDDLAGVDPCEYDTGLPKLDGGSIIFYISRCHLSCAERLAT